MDDKQPEGMKIQVKHGGQVLIDPEKADDQAGEASLREDADPATETQDPDSTDGEIVSDAGETVDPPSRTADRPAKRRK